MGGALKGFGKAMPALEVKNDDLRALVDTSDEWISSRTGISSRHIAVEESNIDLAEAASRAALGWTEDGVAERRFEAEEIDLVVYATATPDIVVPSMAALLRRRLGLSNAAAFDVNAACTGFIYGLTVAESFMVASVAGTVGAAGRNRVRRALVVGAERLSRITDWADRNTCVLFGDGAGAAVLEWDEERPGILSSYIVNDDDTANALTCPAIHDAPQPFAPEGVAPENPQAHGVSEQRIDEELDCVCEEGEPRAREVLHMNGKAVFKFAAEAMSEAVAEVLRRSGVALDEVSVIVPHQANERIIKYAAKKLDIPMERFQLSIGRTGNTSAASVPMALTDAYREGRIAKGDKVILVAFGGGFTSGAVLYEA